MEKVASIEPDVGGGGLGDGPAKALGEIHDERAADEAETLPGDEKRFLSRPRVEPAHGDEQQKRRLRRL